MSILKKIFGDENKKELKKIQPLVDEINSLEPEFEKLDNNQLVQRTLELKELLKQGKSKDEILTQAFTLSREAAKRTLNQRHFDVQIIGGIVLHQGKIAEMKTGEGKTLASTLPIFLNALDEKGIHVVTVNDYLAKRDTVWMGQIYHALGMSVGCITHEAAYIYDPGYQTEMQNSNLPRPSAAADSRAGKPQNENLKLKNQETKQKEDNQRDNERDAMGGFKVVESYLRPVLRKEAYKADILYGTNHEFGFDYLRDNMAYNSEQRVQRELSFAIIDEIDSILIDEARTPMIISAPDTESSIMYKEFARIIPRLKSTEDYELHEKEKAVTLTDEGVGKIERILGIDNIYQEKGIKYLHHLEQALRAEALFQKDRDYVVRTGEIIIVDEFTGRLMPGRRWSGGLHQAVEAKEGLNVNPESLTLASISVQNYFRMYPKLAGMTGTAATSAEEFEKVYNLEVIVIPTNKPMVRKDLADVVYKTSKEKYQAIVGRIKESYQKGQPVLVGTRSIEKNELVSVYLEKQGIKHEVLNAKNHQREGEIIAQAGRKHAVTVATNMAGRGVDIILGGNPPDKKDAEEIKKLGGLLMLGTERHEARRIDNQLRGRSGRQGDQGESQFYLSLEDDLVRIFGGDRIKAIMERFKIPEGQPIQSGIISNAVETAQSKIEGMNFDMRKHLLEYDDVMNIHRTSFYKKRRAIIDAKKDELREKVLAIFEKQGVSKEKFLEKEKEIGEQFFDALRFVCLRVFDSFWVRHLEEMEYLRDRVRLRAYGQMDPLVEYKNEGYKMFKEFLQEIDNSIIQTVLNLKDRGSQPSPGLAEKSVRVPASNQFFGQSSEGQSSGGPGTPAGQRGQKFQKVGRNDPCPCGSGKKFKKCHGKQ
jgi:preprotein translocase subunit SecA